MSTTTATCWKTSWSTNLWRYSFTRWSLRLFPCSVGAHVVSDFLSEVKPAWTTALPCCAPSSGASLLNLGCLWFLHFFLNTTFSACHQSGFSLNSGSFFFLGIAWCLKPHSNSQTWKRTQIFSFLLFLSVRCVKLRAAVLGVGLCLLCWCRCSLHSPL